jgi:primosomal protein N'
MYLSVIPFSHSIGASPLTYVWGDIFSPTTPLGSILEIPLWKSQEYGLLVWTSEENLWDIQDVKTILRVITDRTVIEPYQIDMIISLSRRYMIPIHRVLGFFLTKPTLKRLEKYGYNLIWKKGNQLENEWKKEKNKLIFFGDTIITPDILEKFLENRTIVICPDDFSLENYRKSFENEWTFFFSSELTDTRKAKAWIDIQNGKYERIFWTRRILYYNLAHYTNILYLEDAFSREYFHFPSRIHYLDVLFSLEKHTQFTIQILTSIPLLSTLSRSKNFEIINYS